MIDDDTYSHEWLSRTTMPSKRSDMTATTVGDAIYLVGGCANDQEWVAGAGMYLCAGLTKATEKYLPTTDAYDTLPEAPRSRYRHTAAAVGSRIFIFGGRDIADNIITEVDVLDTQTSTWSTLSNPMPNATSDLSSFVHGDKIYVVGGYNAVYEALDQMMVYDTLESTWSASYPLTQGRGDAASTIADGLAFAVGGFHHGNNFQAPLDHVEVFFTSNPSGGWKSRSTMKVARGDKAVAVLNGMLHVIGGEAKNENGHSAALMDVEVYDARTDTWYVGGSIPSHRFRFVAAAFGDSIYIFGGQGALMGTYGETGSKYPILDVVERYKETVTQAAVSSTPVLASLGALPLLIPFLASI